MIDRKQTTEGAQPRIGQIEVPGSQCQRCRCGEQDVVVAWVQAYGRLIEDVADAAQVGPQLCGKTYALCLATRQRWRGTIKGQIWQPDFAQKSEPRAQLGDDVTRNFGFAALELQAFEYCAHLVDRHGNQLCNGALVPAHRQCFGVQALAIAGGAGVRDAIVAGLVVNPVVEAPVFLFTADVLIFAIAGDLDAGAKAAHAPAVARVEGKQSRVEFCKAPGAGRAGALGREHLQRQRHLEVLLF